MNMNVLTVYIYYHLTSLSNYNVPKSSSTAMTLSESKSANSTHQRWHLCHSAAYHGQTVDEIWRFLGNRLQNGSPYAIGTLSILSCLSCLWHWCIVAKRSPVLTADLLLWSPYVIGQTIIFSSCCCFFLFFFFFVFFLSLFIYLFLSFFSFPRLILAVGHWMSTRLPHMVWP